MSEFGANMEELSRFKKGESNDDKTNSETEDTPQYDLKQKTPALEHFSQTRFKTSQSTQDKKLHYEPN